MSHSTPFDTLTQEQAALIRRKELAFKTEADYRGNLIVCRGAAERIKARCTRLLGDDVQETVHSGRSGGEKRTGNYTTPGTANGNPKSRKRTPEAKTKP